MTIVTSSCGAIAKVAVTRFLARFGCMSTCCMTLDQIITHARSTASYQASRLPRPASTHSTCVHRRGDFGRLGHGDCSDVFLPQPIAFFSGISIARIACGDTHSLACTDTGELYSFGRNQNGQLGLGHNNDITAPARVEALAVCVRARHPAIPCVDCAGPVRHPTIRSVHRRVSQTPSHLVCQMHSLADTQPYSMSMAWPVIHPAI